MTPYRDQIAAAVRAVAVTSSTSYSWFGSGPPPLPRALVAALPRGTVREYLIDALQGELYRSFYVQGRPVPPLPRSAGPARRDHAFVEALSAANTGAGGWEPGWRVENVERDVVRVAKSGLQVRARVSDCRASGRRYEAGSPVSLSRPKELRAASPGYYIALGDTDLGLGREDIEVRIYFTVSAPGAAPLVAACTGLLNDARIPFQLKLIDHPTGYIRRDAAVLYMEGGTFGQARESLCTIASSCASHLRAQAPAFAKPLAAGVSVGEHRPSLGASFGSSRCRLVAEGIIAAYELGVGRVCDRVDAVGRRFAAQGLNIDAPYLAPGSSSRYAL